MKPVFVVVFLVLVPLVFGNTEYSVVGGNDSDFVLGLGFFNSALPSYDTYTRSITRDSGVPLVSDLDGDGVNEIVVLDSNTVRLYHGKTLDIVDSLNVDSGFASNSFYGVFNIDGDSFNEIILVGRLNNTIAIFEYNGTSFREEYNFVHQMGEHSLGGDRYFNCRESDKLCLLVGSPYTRSHASTPARIYIQWFNSSGVSSYYTVESSIYEVMCSPQIPVVSIKDYDNDGSEEFIFSYIEGGYSGVNDGINIVYVDKNSSFGYTVENHIEFSTGADLVGNNVNDDCVTENGAKYFTSPLVFDIDGSSSNGLETVVGVHVQSDEFKMYSYNSDGSFLDDYPEILHADGVIVSNVMRFNSHTDTGREDFCVLGYENVERQLDLICASEQSGDFPETHEFFFSLGSFYNVSGSYGNWERIAHAVQHSTVTTDGNNLDEVLSSYGVFDLEYHTFPIPDEIVLIFENPKSNAVVLSVDVERVGREDLLAMTSTNLWFIDDKFTNAPATISQYYVDPCIDNTWKVNTSVEVRITAVDPEGDDVNVSAVLYSGASFNQSSIWQSVPSGTTVPFWFVANRTIGSAVLRLMAKDVENPSVVDVIDLAVSVSLYGIEWGSGCITEVDLTAVPTNVSVAPADLSEDEKAEIRGYVMGSGFIPMNYAPIVAMICVIVLSVGSALVMAQHGIRDGMALLYIPLAVGVASWLFFVFIGMIAGWTVIVAIVLASAGIGYKVYHGHSQGIG